MSLYHKAKIKGGRLIMNDKNAFIQSIKRSFDGNCLVVIINTTDRSNLDWQKIYRVILGEMGNHLGYSKDDMHELAKADVLSEMSLASTTELDEQSWPEYMQRLSDWAHSKFDFII